MARTWNLTSLPTRPGLYINFVEAAAAQIKGGARGIVAMPIMNYDSTSSEKAEEKKVYKIETISEAKEKFGENNIDSIKLALQGGAREVLAYAMPEVPDYEEMRNEFDKHTFNVFVYDGEAEVDDTEMNDTKAWVKNNREEGKHFMAVLGNMVDGTVPPALADGDGDYIVNLVNGVKFGDEEHTSQQYASYIAGLIAGTPINKSITYKQVHVDDVNVRLTNSDVNETLEKGGLVLVHDGEKVKVEQGITSSGQKIRAIRARQAVATDINKTAKDSYIGKLDNSEDGQAALISAIKAYLERLENANVLTEIQVGLDPENPSVGDQVFLVVSYREIDSMERIFININV
ncbi:phage tail sheath subtilisin-like domain-containing protein [Chengkuizengella sp. SCS-71B]|uniref:phage tail sheath subtilisin-like domain-containing protein n=1 Tax=Chengkuizengella sp. SCS-71B TaxID=3115290 RepID=UPI0032C21861